MAGRFWSTKLIIRNPIDGGLIFDSTCHLPDLRLPNDFEDWKSGSEPLCIFRRKPITTMFQAGSRIRAARIV